MNDPKWRKILAGADMACIIVAVVSLTVSIFLGYQAGFPANGPAFLFRFLYWALMGVHFVLHGILNWKEQRGLAIVELGAVAFMLVLVVLAFLR